ncbi:hypothetical protein BS78_09G208900 [Paspalum vaginatum]|nr:hypothetical protein BS78_09G208900 [Paspalum vaginatum]
MPVRRRQPRRRDTGATERYREMGIGAALSRSWDYPTACGELAALLRLGYADLPKAAQALVASDVLLAFRVLPDVQTGYALSAANALLQAVEIALPKHKKAQAVSEFKQSVVAHKRRARVQQNSGSPHIPQDILVHIFSFLDMHSLVAAGLVCWSWNSASNNNYLWKMNYSLFFGLCHLNCNNNIPESCKQYSCDIVQDGMNSVPIKPNFSWKESFHNKYKECASWKFVSNRELCGHCRSVIWLSNLTCASPHNCPKNGKDDAKFRPLLPDTVAKYILRIEDLAASSSESDGTDDSDYENGHPRFWTL